jgi:hypothetical protein
VTSVAALVPDLMDRSRIEAALAPRGATVVFAATAGHLADAASGVTVVLVDLEAPGALGAVASVIEAATHPRVIGFGSHVERSLLDEGRRAGCDEVMARSAFFRRLGALLASDPAPTGTTGPSTGSQDVASPSPD